MNATLPGPQRLDVQTADLDWQTHADTCCMKCGLLNVRHTNPLQIHLDTKTMLVPQRLPAAGPASERQGGPARSPAQKARSCLATPGPTWTPSPRSSRYLRAACGSAWCPGVRRRIYLRADKDPRNTHTHMHARTQANAPPS